jgi:hypothetical protein
MMKVAMLVGVLLINVLAGLYQSGLVADSGSVGIGEVRACEDVFPPPPNWP